MTQTTTVTVHRPVARHVKTLTRSDILDISFGNQYDGSVSFLMTGEQWDDLVADVARRRAELMAEAEK